MPPTPFFPIFDTDTPLFDPSMFSLPATRPGGGGGRAGDNQFGDFGTGMPSVNMFPTAGPPGRTRRAGGGVRVVEPMFPQFSQDFFSFLTGQIGRGATPFPGDVNAPRNTVLDALEAFYGGTGPGPAGFSTLQQLSETGLPISRTPEWEAMVAAMDRSLREQGANLREQFAFRGNLASSPFGNAAADFYTQAALERNALLAGMETSALEAARGRQLDASRFLAEGAGGIAQYLQTLSQDEIDRMLAEFIRTRPEYSPFLNMLFAGATTFPPALGERVGVGGLGAALQGAGSIATGVADLWETIRGRRDTPPTGGGGGGGNPFWG